MKIAVLGAGVIGVTTAYYLARAGHEVVVLDRRPGPALETSFANAGEISPGYASPWAAPSIPLKALQWLAMKHPPLIIRPKLDMAMVRWTLAMLRNCTAARYALNKERMVRIAEYSRDQLIALRAETGIEYHDRAQGTLQLFRTHKQLAGVAKDIKVLNAAGVPCELLDPAGCIAAEPGLATTNAAIAGGLRLPNDETGDCHLFTSRLAAIAAGLGVDFRYGVDIRGLAYDGAKVTAVQTAAYTITADAYVVAMGSYSPPLVRPLGLNLPVYPVKGYSITAPVVDEARAPVSTVMDETYKVAITRLGGRIRVGGMAELNGFDHALPVARRATLEHSVASVFPGAGDLSRATFWSGLRPMTPDSTPVVGATDIPNLFLNTGHGTLGWTMACGSGQVLADLIGAVTPAIDVQDLDLSRYS
ncbi:MAG: dadA [Brevundimonas sp.]|nr:dadA [Brevundimonas sp.]